MKATNGYCSGHREAFPFYFPPFWCRVEREAVGLWLSVSSELGIAFEDISVPMGEQTVHTKKGIPKQMDCIPYPQSFSASTLPHRRERNITATKFASSNTRAGGGVCGSRNGIMVEANVRMASADDCQLSGTWAMLGEPSSPASRVRLCLLTRINGFRFGLIALGFSSLFHRVGQFMTRVGEATKKGRRNGVDPFAVRWPFANVCCESTCCMRHWWGWSIRDDVAFWTVSVYVCVDIVRFIRGGSLHLGESWYFPLSFFQQKALLNQILKREKKPDKS